MKLTDREWKEFKIAYILKSSFNAKPYHTSSLTITKNKGIPYITRTNMSNGLQYIVENCNEFKINPKNTIVFGAENATYFYQPFKYITGNKMYYYDTSKLSQEVGLFITCCLNSSIKECGFGYGMGLTGTRSDTRKLHLPINAKGEPDYQFMEDYVKKIMHRKRQEYIDYAQKILAGGGKQILIKLLISKKWKAFKITDIFTDIQRGKRLVKEKQKSGKMPYVSSTAMNNGIDNFIQYDILKMRKYKNCLSMANSGSVGSTFYEPFSFVASDHVTHLKNDDFSKNIYLFIATLGNRLSQKYNFNREINDTRISREKLMLPVDDKGNPDYEYMEYYTQNKMLAKYKDYLQYMECVSNMSSRVLNPFGSRI